MIDHLLFNGQKFIPETNEIKTRLAEYDQLRTFHDTAVKQVDHRQIGDIKFRVWIDENGKIQYKQQI